MKDIDTFLKKMETAKKEVKFDLSKDEDLSIALMNLISLEEHFFFTAKKTEKDKYFDLIKEIRTIRQELQKKLVKESEGELWCIGKHLLAASMRLYEVGTKELGQGNSKSAKEMFERSYNLYSLFWGLNLNLIDPGKIESLPPEKLSKNEPSGSQGIFAKLKAVVKKAVDCCIEQ